MKTIVASIILMAVSTNAFAACISPQEKNHIRQHARFYGSVKLFVSHTDLPLGTPVDVIQAMTAARVAELNAEGTVLYLTQSGVPSAAPGFEAFVTAEGVEKLYVGGYCFGRIN